MLSLQTRAEIQNACTAAIAADPEYASKPLTLLNKEATEHQKCGHHIQAIAAFHKLFAKVKQKNIVHAELYTCHSNRAVAYLQVRGLKPFADSA